MTALQYCFGFCRITMWISHKYTYVSSLLNLPHPCPIPPLSLVAEHQFPLSLLWGNFLLAIYFTYGNMYVSMLLSQFVPPSSSSTVSRVCSLCLCQDMESTWMSINRWMDKEVVVHIYNGILFSHIKGMNLSQFWWGRGT